MDELEALVALRRAQLVELRAMAADCCDGAAAGVARVERELAKLGHPVDAEPTDHAATEAELAAAAAPASSVDADTPTTLPPAVAAKPRPRRSRAKARSKVRSPRR